MYFKHESPKLKKAFAERRFQGAEPESAKFLFVGLDANYDKDIASSPIFPELLDYLKDGVRFWNKYKVHHPFLLPSYTGDGLFYHQSFAEIGFTPEEAGDVSFIELVHVPTYGTSDLKKEDLNREHLQRLNKAIMDGNSKYIFVSGDVGRLMKSSRAFPWIPKDPASEAGPLKIWFKSGSKTVYWHYHFSVYGKYEAEKQKQLRAIAELRR